MKSFIRFTVVGIIIILQATHLLIADEPINQSSSYNYFYPSMGVTYTTIWDTDSKYDNLYATGFVGGLEYEFLNLGIDDTWQMRMRSGLRFITRNFDLGEYLRVDDSGTILGKVHSAIISKTYIVLPIGVSYYRNYYFARGGVYLGYFLNSTINGKDNEDLSYSRKREKIDAGLEAAIGIKISHFLIGYRLDLGLVHDNYERNMTHNLFLELRIKH